MVNWGFREYWFLKLFPFPNLDNLLNSEKLYEFFFAPPPNDRNSCLAVLTTNRKWCPYPKLCFYQVWRKSCEPFLRLLGGGESPIFSKKMLEPPSGRYWCLVGRTTIRKWYPHPNYNSIKFEENSVSHFWGYKGRGSPIFFEKNRRPLLADIDVWWGERSPKNNVPTPNYVSIKFGENRVSRLWGY